MARARAVDPKALLVSGLVLVSTAMAVDPSARAVPTVEFVSLVKPPLPKGLECERLGALTTVSVECERVEALGLPATLLCDSVNPTILPLLVDAERDDGDEC